MNVRLWLAVLLLLVSGAQVRAQNRPSPLEWKDLPALPDTPGLGGPFAGVHGEVLLVAGGANFPVAPPWENGQKVWYDDVYVLEPGADSWFVGGTLDRNRAYGASISTPDGVLLIGGCDAGTVFADVTRLQWDPVSRVVHETPLPALPRPASFLSAAQMGDVVYVAAGQETTDPASLVHGFWSLDLADGSAGQQWQELPAWPGPARIKALAAVQDTGRGPAFFLFSGETPTPNEQGDLNLEYQTDAYRFEPGQENPWTRLADLSKPVAAGSIAPVGPSHLLVFSGSTGAHVTGPVQDRPEFPADILSYHTITDTWVTVGQMPRSVVTTALVEWQGYLVLTSGEIRPGVRTPRVQAATVQRPESRLGGVDSTVLALYLVALIGMGVFFARREKGTNDYFLAGNRIPGWAAGLSIYATQLSAITFLSIPAVAYATDWVVLPSMLAILAMAPLVIAFYLPFYRRLGLTTAYEYLERRFSTPVRLFGSLSFVAYQLLRMAIVLYLPALALSTVTGLDVIFCILVMGGLATLYTVLGGMEAVVWTDVLQVFVLIGGLVLGLILILVDLGGPGAVWNVAREADKTRLLVGSWSTTELCTWSILVGSFFLQFGPYTTDQAVVQRYLTTKDERSAARAIWLNGAMSVPFVLLFFAMGTCLYAFFQLHPEHLDVGMAQDEILPLFVVTRLPVGLAGLMIAGVFAASMSSLDSSMHSIATALTTDFYRRFRRATSDGSALRVARWITVIAGIVGTGSALILATQDIRSQFLYFQKVLGLVSSGLAGIFILGIFTRRANATGALVGAVVSTVLLVFVAGWTDVHFYLYGAIGILSCVVVGYLVSVVSARSKADLTGLTWHSLPRRVGESS